MSSGPVAWRIERRGALDAEVSESFHDLYERSFGPLRIRAAARHVLTRAEFDEEMRTDAIDKYVAVGPGGEVGGLTTLTNDLTAVPWISPEYYAHRWPEHSARGAVYYLGITLADPEHRRRGAFEAMQAAIARRLIAEDAICVWDMCAFNVEVSGFATAIEGLLRETATSGPAVVDTQRYYVAGFGSGPAAGEVAG